MTNERLEQIIREIWDSIPRDAGKITFCEEHNEGGDVLIGNCDGLIRFAGELLYVAQNRIPLPGADVAYLLTKNSRVVSNVACAEELTELPPSRLEGWKKNIVNIGVLTVLLFLLISMVVGVVTIITGLAK